MFWVCSQASVARATTATIWASRSSVLCPTVAYGKSRNPDSPHRCMLEASILDAEEHLLHQFLWRMLRPNWFATVVEIEASLPDRSEGFLPLLRRECRICSLSKPTDMVGSMNSRSAKPFRLGTVKVSDVDDNLRLRGNTRTNFFNDAEKIVEIEVVHCHEEKGIQIASRRERLSFYHDLVNRRVSSCRKSYALLRKHRATFAWTWGCLDPDLSQEHRLIAESSSRDSIGHCHKKPRLQRSLRKLQEVAAVILCRSPVRPRPAEMI